MCLVQRYNLDNNMKYWYILAQIWLYGMYKRRRKDIGEGRGKKFALAVPVG